MWGLHLKKLANVAALPNSLQNIGYLAKITVEFILSTVKIGFIMTEDNLNLVRVNAIAQTSYPNINPIALSITAAQSTILFNSSDSYLPSKVSLDAASKAIS